MQEKTREIILNKIDDTKRKVSFVSHFFANF